jgi:hypothetical protein
MAIELAQERMVFPNQANLLRNFTDVSEPACENASWLWEIFESATGLKKFKYSNSDFRNRGSSDSA